ncbi:MAG TPA: hypothetical protein VFD83_05630 [Candidatus Polarisedimenticolia bacterium]|nr:hypothetical protein [Candidatus Polarisedimenticolia bacterium]
MRIRVPGRFIAVLAILTAVLCLLPASTKTAVARPIGWTDVGPTNPDSDGDNDGVVLKQKSGAAPTTLAAGAGTSTTGSVTTHSRWAGLYHRGGLRMFFTVARRLDYWLFLLR